MRLKLADNTIIFYSSDNGAEDYRIGNASNGGVGNTGPLRARKRSMYEGGIRTFGLRALAGARRGGPGGRNERDRRRGFPADDLQARGRRGSGRACNPMART